MKVHIDVFGRDDIVDEHRYIFAEMLKKQGKVRGDLTQKTDRCCFISIAKINDKTIAIGAIKQKTASDFHPNKANLENLSSQFSWELGYIYTDPEYRGKGLAKKIVTSLLSAYGDDNLMASTELEKILEWCQFLRNMVLLCMVNHGQVPFMVMHWDCF